MVATSRFFAEAQNDRAVAVYTLTRNGVTLNNCTLSGNSAYGGGAISSAFGSVTVNDSILSNNTTSDYGGGALDTFHGSVLLSNSTIAGNSAGHGGGITTDAGAMVSISNSTLAGNTAEFGGAMEHLGT